MAYVYSDPIEDLIQRAVEKHTPSKDDEIVIEGADVVIVGSGYGGSVAAMKIAGLRKKGTPIDVLVLERGKEYAVGEFPNTTGELPGHVRFLRPSDSHPTGNPDALYDLRVGHDVDILLGSGLGGGSLVNANVAAEPDPEIFDAWPEPYRNRGLDEGFEEIKRLLDPTPHPSPARKYDALVKLGDALGGAVRKAPITVTQGPRPGETHTNAVGLPQRGCTGCGNCFTGCNVGAKNTLAVNLIPLAATRGARFVTGVNVLTVERAPGSGGEPQARGRRWRLRVQRTRSIRTPLEREYFIVEADYVILAAGALGSTEILLRSQKMEGGLDLSQRLGTRFSTNGDALAMSFGEANPVDALGTPDIHSGQGPGPTITGMVRGTAKGDDGRVHRYTLEDGAVPGSLVRLFGDLVTTGAALGRLGNNALPRWLELRPDLDPLGYDVEALRHSQLLLLMTDDGAKRKLGLSPSTEGPDDPTYDELVRRHVVVEASCKEERGRADPALVAIDRLMTRESRKAGFSGGQYVPNPLWRLLPDSADSALSGTLPGRRNVSVHPLGGCGMGVDRREGVVSPDCQVFDGKGGVHQGLYVMDGAVIPGALATNPFLTIAAVAWRASDELVRGLLRDDGWEGGMRAEHATERKGREVHHEGDRQPEPPRLILREQMLGRLRPASRGTIEAVERLLPGAEDLFAYDGMVLRFRTDPFDPRAQLSRPSEPIAATAELHANPLDEELAELHKVYGTPPGLEEEKPLASGTATVTLLEPDDSGGPHIWRSFLALLAYVARRDPSMGRAPSWGAPPSGGILRRVVELGRWLWTSVVGLCRIAGMHARYRRFRYDVELHTPKGVRISFTADKKIRWRPFAPRLWDAMLSLPIERLTFDGTDGTRVEAGADLRVDAGYMLDEGLIQMEASATDMVESVASTLSFLGWMQRCLLETGFWEFGAPTYPKKGKAKPIRLDPPPLRVGLFRSVAPELVPLPLQGPKGEPGLELELVRYPRPSQGAGTASPERGPVLLIHGLAQGSGIYNSRRMRRNMARHMWRAGYDVWLLDYRLSNRFDRNRVPFTGFGIDAIGRDDIPAAVKKVYRETGKPVKVFAHCVGAIGTQMAILGAELETNAGEKMLESVCFNAIHPWIMPSPANLVRFKLGEFARTWVSDNLLDPIVRAEDAEVPLKSMVDRIAFSLARIGEHATPSQRHPPRLHLKRLRGPPEESGICDRMTFFYGRMWNHGNLEGSVRSHWRELVGPAPDEVYEQLYYLIERERILDDEGNNTYLTRDNVREYWSGIPTFFIHGDDSAVFNPQSATRSAVRLQQLFRKHRNPGDRETPVCLRRYPGYGHMDPILARSADERVYPDIVRFFEQASKWRRGEEFDAVFDEIVPRHDPERHEVHDELETGEIIRAAWISGGDKTITIRRWAEKYRFNTVNDGEVMLVDGTVPPLGERDEIRLDGCKPWFVWWDSETVPARYRAPRALIDPVRGGIVQAPADADLGKLVQKLGLDDRARPSPDLEAELCGALGLPASPPDTAAPPEPVATDAQPPWYRRLVRRMGKQPGPEDTFNFLVGSCRYPGSPVERDNADAIFRGMLDHIEERGRDDDQALDMAFFLGDQIYADAYADIFQSGGWWELYTRSYMKAFRSPRFAEVLKALPIHFAIDDHEIVDDFTGRNEDGKAPARAHRGPQELTPVFIDDDQVTFALGTARSYMSSAREKRAVGGAPQPEKESLWYELDYDSEVSFPCFVLDTRSQREPRAAHRHHAKATYPTMLEKRQLDHLRDWLERANGAARDRPKFIFAGQVIAPVSRHLVEHPALFHDEDGFLGYPGTLREIVRCIVENDIRNVVFVGGDLHLSCAAQLELRVGRKKVLAWQIVASGLYAPLPFANRAPSDCVWRRDDEEWQRPEVMPDAWDAGVGYRAEWLTTGVPHFLGVSVGKEGRDPAWIVDIRAYDRTGARIRPTACFDERAGDVRMRFGP